VAVRILVIEDDSNVRERLQRQLAEGGHEVETAATGEEGLRIGMERDVSAAIVDLGLPGIGGMEVLRGWRRSSRGFPVLILSARSSWTDKVEALSAGADDYVTKPFQFEEIDVRLRAIVRRAAMGREANALICGPVVLDISRQHVAVSGRTVNLSSYEHRLLHCLMSHAGAPVSKNELVQWMLADHCERHGETGDGGTLKAHISLLRQKLDPNGELRLIETLRGQGYRFTLPSEH
jgi:two-component system response regulator PhoP